MRSCLWGVLGMRRKLNRVSLSFWMCSPCCDENNVVSDLCRKLNRVSLSFRLKSRHTKDCTIESSSSLYSTSCTRLLGLFLCTRVSACHCCYRRICAGCAGLRVLRSFLPEVYFRRKDFKTLNSVCELQMSVLHQQTQRENFAFPSWSKLEYRCRRR